MYFTLLNFFDYALLENWSLHVKILTVTTYFGRKKQITLGPHLCFHTKADIFGIHSKISQQAMHLFESNTEQVVCLNKFRSERGPLLPSILDLNLFTARQEAGHLGTVAQGNNAPY